MENLNILSKWDETGLLQGIVPEMKEMVASGLESLASLLSKDSDFESERSKRVLHGNCSSCLSKISYQRKSTGGLSALLSLQTLAHRYDQKYECVEL